MKKWIASLLTVMLLMGAASAFAQDKPIVAASNYPLYCMAQAVAGENAEIVYAKERKEERQECSDRPLCWQ